VDLAATDPDAALQFYGALFAWEATPPDGAGPPYWMWHKDGHAVSGLFVLGSGESAAPRWQSYVAVADADDTTRRAQSLGGEVLARPQDAGRSGRFAHLRDPGGAMVALWQAQAHSGFGLFNSVGAPCWHELHTRDIEASVAFYGSLCGWRHRISDSVPGGQYHLFSNAEGAKCGGLMPIGDDWEAYGGPVNANWAVYFGVADCDATVAQAQALGGTLKYPVMELPRIGRFAALTDPQGAGFWVIQFAGDHD
jgi:hypothetical protein